MQGVISYQERVHTCAWRQHSVIVGSHTLVENMPRDAFVPHPHKIPCLRYLYSHSLFIFSKIKNSEQAVLAIIEFHLFNIYKSTDS